LVPSDANPTATIEEDGGGDAAVAPAIHELDVAENDCCRRSNVKQRLSVNLPWKARYKCFENAANEIGAPDVAMAIRTARESVEALDEVDLEPIKNKVLNTAKRFGKHASHNSPRSMRDLRPNFRHISKKQSIGFGTMRLTEEQRNAVGEPGHVCLVSCPGVGRLASSSPSFYGALNLS